MRIILLLLMIAATTTTQAQKPIDPKPFANSMSEADLKKRLYIVASKDFEGRETATEGQRKAAAYIENHFRSLSLRPACADSSYQLYYPVFRDSLTDIGLKINEQPFIFGADYEADLNADYTSTMLNSEIIFAGYGITDSAGDDYKGLDVKGRIVLLLDGMPSGRLQSQIRNKTYNPFAKQDNAQLHGAMAVLIIQHDFPRSEPVTQGKMYLNGYKKAVRPNTWYVSEKIARTIMGDTGYAAARNGDIKPQTYHADILLQFSKATLHLQSSDVLGYLEGTDLKDEIVVISAHYDHLGKRDTVIYYGADDDGSGTVSMLEIATAFSKAKAAGKGPRRSILFLANSGEEKGLWGSAYYTDHPCFAMDKTTVDLNIDMIGRIDPGRKHGDSTNYIYVVGDDKLSSDLHTISESVNKKYTKLELDYKFNDPKDPQRIYFRSDHYNFARKGVPIIFYFDGIHGDYHRPTDTPDKINYDLMLKRARFVFYTAWNMANRDKMLVRDIPLK